MLNLKRNWKASTALLVSGLTLTQASLAPRQSHAIVAAATGGTAIPALIVLGAGSASTLIGGGLFVKNICIISGGCHSNDGEFLLGLGMTFAGIAAVIVGIALLDETGAPTPDFQVIMPDKAQEAGISSREMRAFNNQIDRVNSVSESIARGIAQGGFTAAEPALSYAHSEWTEARESGLISADAFAALGKLSDLAARRVQAQAAK